MAMKKFHLTLCAVLLAVSAAAHEGENHQEKGGDARWASCKADAEKLCKDVKPGEGRVMECLKAHEAELSAGCKSKGDELKQAKAGLESACAKDKEALCKEVKPGDGRIGLCFKEHEKELSEGCRSFLAKKKDEMMEKRPGTQACAADKEKFCSDVKPGEGRVIECMKSHKEELSGACRDFMASMGDMAGKKR